MTLTTRPALANQLTLPGQAATPEGPVDGSGMYLMHHAFRRDLANFAGAAARTPVQARETWRALQRRWTRFGAILHSHHHVEDAFLWPLLTRKAEGDQAALETLQAMAAEHALIDPILRSCSALLARLANAPDKAARAELSTQLASARDVLGAHLAHEEREAMALVQRLLTVEDWAGFEKQVSSAYGMREIPHVISWMMHELPAEGLARLAHDAPAVMLLLYRLFWRRSFERLERTAFQYA
jgi:hypothetical protein